ncbi:hypothetical protein SCMC78_25520 [Streptomyces sp. CMC78]|uniref:Uncharacterized protein n=1 Tax=Streptomyces sp. CMC78 TaxID=3231512 RepID=A0AB33KEF2_9ACTN
MESGTDTGSSSALAAAVPSAHIPVAVAAMAMDRRMFLCMGVSDPSKLFGSPEKSGRGQTCSAPARQVEAGNGLP